MCNSNNIVQLESENRIALMYSSFYPTRFYSSRRLSYFLSAIFRLNCLELVFLLARRRRKKIRYYGHDYPVSLWNRCFETSDFQTFPPAAAKKPSKIFTTWTFTTESLSRGRQTDGAMRNVKLCAGALRYKNVFF